MSDVPIVRFSEAEAVGADVRERWSSITGEEPGDATRWGDLVQLVLRRARDRVAQREA